MKNVIFTGWISGPEEAAPYYAAADLFVMPSVAEPFGLVAPEAALLDTPVIISKTSGCGDVFNHCLKTDFWDTKLLASHIYSILNHRGLSYEMIKNGKRNAENITWAKAAKNVEKVYNQII